MIDLEPLDREGRTLAEKPIGYPRVVAATSEGDLDFSNDRWARRIDRRRFQRCYLLIGTGSQRNNHADQKYQPDYVDHNFSFHAH